MLTSLPWLALGLSVSFNALLLVLLKKSKSTQSTYDAINLLHDLTAGIALVKITRVAPEDVLLRSTRGMR